MLLVKEETAIFKILDVFFAIIILNVKYQERNTFYKTVVLMEEKPFKQKLFVPLMPT